MKTFVSKDGALHISFLHFLGPALGVFFLGIASGMDALWVWIMDHTGRRWADLKPSELLLLFAINLIMLAALAATLWIAELQTSLVISSDTVSVRYRRTFTTDIESYPLSAVRFFVFRYKGYRRQFFRDAILHMHVLPGPEKCRDILRLPYIRQARKAHAAMLHYFSAQGKSSFVGDLPIS